MENINISEFKTQLIAIAIFLICFIFRGLFSSIILKIISLITKNKGKVKESKGYRTLKQFFVLLGLYCAIRVFEFNGEILDKVNCAFKILFIILLTNFINSFITKDAKWIKKYLDTQKNKNVGNIICKVIKGIIWIISVYIIVKELGYDLTGLIAGFGLGGVILSLAAQDTVKSLLSGAIILTDKPFNIGDYIEVGDKKGTVIDMTFRSTRIKATDNSIITIPNSTITSENIVNWNKLSSRRLEFTLNLSMNTKTEKIKDLVEKIKLILKNTDEILKDTIQVNLSQISSYSSDIQVVAYIDEVNYAKFLNIKEKIFCYILELVENENIDLAYPTQTIYVKNQENKAQEEENV